MIETDTQRRVLVHLMVPRTMGEIERALAREVGVQNSDDGRPVSEISVREVINDLEALGCVKGFSAGDPHTLNKITQKDPDVITHDAQPQDPDGILSDEVATRNRGQVWADRLNDPRKPGVFQPDAEYFLMTQDAFDFLTTPGPDIPPEHEGLEPGPAIIGQIQARAGH